MVYIYSNVLACGACIFLRLEGGTTHIIGHFANRVHLAYTTDNIHFSLQ